MTPSPAHHMLWPISAVDMWIVVYCKCTQMDTVYILRQRSVFYASLNYHCSFCYIFCSLHFPSTLYLTLLQLEGLCSGETLDMAKQEELSESLVTSVSATLDLVDTDSLAESSQFGVPAHLNAAHLLVSAIEGERGYKHFPAVF